MQGGKRCSWIPCQGSGDCWKYCLTRQVVLHSKDLYENCISVFDSSPIFFLIFVSSKLICALHCFTHSMILMFIVWDSRWDFKWKWEFSLTYMVYPFVLVLEYLKPSLKLLWIVPFFSPHPFSQLINSCYILNWVGWVVSTLLAGATVGSFTGGALADKFGRTRTFQLDAIPLIIGAFLWFVLSH